MLLGKSLVKTLGNKRKSQIIKSLRLATQFFNNPRIAYQWNYSLKNKFSSLKPNMDSKPFIFNAQSQPQLIQLQLEYRQHQNIQIFEPTIKNSTGILNQMNIFKIFKIMQASQYSQEAYQQFFQLVQANIKKKSDNILLLLATVKERIAKYNKQEKHFQNALKNLQESLDILENSRVPPLFQYYSIYREYGLLHFDLGQKQKAKQILIESVDILDDFVSHSDDNVSSNDYCKKQAASCNALSQLDPQNSKKWIQKANKQWDSYTDNKFDEIQYAKTIAESFKNQLQKDKQKAESLYHFNLYKFEKKQLKDILKQAKQESSA